MRETYLDVLEDAGWENCDFIEWAWFSNCGMGNFGHSNIRGQVCFMPVVREGLFPESIPIINIEGGCATPSMAFHGVWKDVASGDKNVSLAIGAKKTFFQSDAAKTMKIFEGGIGQINLEEWHAYYCERGEESRKPSYPNSGGGTVF